MFGVVVVKRVGGLGEGWCFVFGNSVLVCPCIYVDVFFFVSSAMNTLKTTLHGHTKQAAPEWIEVKLSDIIHELFCTTDIFPLVIEKHVSVIISVLFF